MSNPFLPVIGSLFAEPHASLLAGILFGVKSSFSPSLYNGLITTGTLHIVALSGMNISILIALMGKIFTIFGRKSSSIFLICLIVLFVLFVGPTPSVIRAALMGSFSLLALYFGRKEWSLLSLFLAAGIMLLFQFRLIFAISFQLSFLATLGIILANKKVERKKDSGLSEKAFYSLRESFWITISAQIFTLPIILYNFHRVSLIAPLANILIEWAIAPIMIIGFITVVIGWVWLPLAILPSWMLWVLLEYVIRVVMVCSAIPFASIEF